MENIFFIDVADCLRRKIDAQRVQNYLILNNYLIVSKIDIADYIVIITCGVTNDKIVEAVDAITQAQKYSARIIVLGCASTTDPKALPDNITAIPIDKMYLLDDIFESEVKFEEVPVPKQSNEEDSLFYFPICRGCTEGCAYCATRKAVGNIKSVPLNECVEMFQKLLASNPDRIIFDGDNIGAYGKDIKHSLGDLLLALPDIPKDYLLNIDMLHPVYFLDNFYAILERIKKKDIGFLLIPFQSGNPRVLKLMNRRGSISEVIRRLEEIRTYDSGVILGTHVIIGFPSETDEEFSDTINALKEAKLDWIRVFCFSVREDTKASKMSGHISTAEMEKRLESITSEMKKNGYFAKKNPSGVTFCRKRLAIERQYETNPYRLPCYREVIDL